MQFTTYQSGEARAVADQGTDRALYAILKTENLGQNKIALNLQQASPPNTFYFQFLLGPGRFRPWFGKSGTGQVIINDGISLTSQLPMKWRIRCNLAAPPQAAPQPHFGPIGRPVIIGTPR
jgi:hypothetical protein